MCLLCCGLCRQQLLNKHQSNQNTLYLSLLKWTRLGSARLDCTLLRTLKARDVNRVGVGWVVLVLVVGHPFLLTHSPPASSCICAASHAKRQPVPVQLPPGVWGARLHRDMCCGCEEQR